MNHWAFVRIGLIGFVGISSGFAPVDPSAASVIGWEVVAVGFFFFPAAVCIGLGLLLPFSRTKLKWTTPSWKINPFDFSQPEQFFHMAAYGMLAMGAGVIAAEHWIGNAISAYAVTTMALGIGILVGLQILGLVARRQTKSES